MQVRVPTQLFDIRLDDSSAPLASIVPNAQGVLVIDAGGTVVSQRYLDRPLYWRVPKNLLGDMVRTVI